MAAFNDDDDDDVGFAALPPSLRRKIDDAFTRSCHRDEPTRRRRRGDPSPPSGGFIVDNVPGGFILDGSTSGGFMNDNSSLADHSDPDVPSSIPLSLVPTALQFLDLQPDDDDVLSVFRNAASGWGDSRSSSEPGNAVVSRKDWRAVCAALLDAGAFELDSEGDVPMQDGERVAVERDGGDGAGSVSDSAEEYVHSGGSEYSGSDDEDSDDDYWQGGFVHPKKGKSKFSATTSTRRRRSQARKPCTSSSEDDSESTGELHKLSARQKTECRAAFALFFPDVAEKDLDDQRIRIKDITRVAQLLKEKISTEETVEMLEAFSTTLDKSMTLGDFERMMIAAKMA